jgi:UDP-2,3-diacylglucosamine hydrolase
MINASDQPHALGILAGGGPLPGRVAAAAVASGRPVFIVGLEGFAERAVIAPWPHVFLRMGAVRGIFGALRQNGCKDLVLIGPVRRPSFLDLRPDADGAKMLARIGRAAFSGDDGLLSAVIRVLGEEGFRVLGAHEILNEALGPRGLLTRTGPDATAMADIRRGIGVTRALGAADVGQSCVVRAGVVIAVEAVEGTDAMLSRCGALLDAMGMAKPGGVLVKSVKPGQDRRADLPTIGPDTIRHAADAGLSGVAYDAGGTILAERAACIARADETGLFLLGFDADIDPIGTTAKGS